MKILLTGGTGLLGTELTKKLIEKGYEVNILVRKITKQGNQFLWDPDKDFIDAEAFKNVSHIIHLAGAKINQRWTATYKKEIYNSRINTAKLLKKYCLDLNINLKSFITASGINYYGTFTSNIILTENDGVLHKDFLSEVCQDWEKAADDFGNLAERIVKIRTSVVLSNNGGAFKELIKITQNNLASGIGSGKQWFNWIHIEDLVNLYIKAIEDQNLFGAYNAVATELLTQKDFMKLLAQECHKTFIPINTPGFLIKLMFGEMAEIILEGTRISNDKIRNTGFVFLYPEIKDTLKELLKP